MDITVRAATAQDYQALAVIMDELHAYHRKHRPDVFGRPDGHLRSLAEVEAMIATPEVGLLVAELDGQMAGFVYLVLRDAPPLPIFESRRWAIVENLAVQEGLHRLGVGRALMQHADAWALAHGATSVELGVWEFNHEAIAFYRALGYSDMLIRMGKPLAQRSADEL